MELRKDERCCDLGTLVPVLSCSWAPVSVSHLLEPSQGTCAFLLEWIQPLGKMVGLLNQQKTNLVGNGQFLIAFFSLWSNFLDRNDIMDWSSMDHPIDFGKDASSHSQRPSASVHVLLLNKHSSRCQASLGPSPGWATHRLRCSTELGPL